MRVRTAMLIAALIPFVAPAAAPDGPMSVPPAPTSEGTPSQTLPATAAPLTSADAEAWLDGFLPYALKMGDIAGAVVVIVKDGQVLLQKGYGYADVEARKPVDPETTLFRPGSVSKLLTWTAVMQQVEQGKLDLDTDVSTYIDFEIPARDGKPITLRNVMTHTSGLEEQAKGLMSTENEPIDSISDHLRSWVPERIFAPGSTPAYSNYATALAGYIVERVSGMSFDDYIDQNVLAPLGMEHSSFRQPLPEKLKPLMSKGYALASQPAKEFEVIGGLAPAGSLSASGADMGKFMIAHLQNGAFGSQRILQEATAKQMHETALTILPRLHRMLLGFYEQDYNGHRAFGHGGDTQWFHSNLHLFPDDGVGLFISMNSSGKAGAPGDIRSALFEQFTDRYLPGPTLDGKVDEKTAAEHARMMAGLYDNSRRMDSSFLSLLNLLGAVKVVPNEDGTITATAITNLAGVPIKWREVEPFVWRDADGKNLLAAEVKDGQVTRFSLGEISPFMVFEPVPASRSPGWLLPLVSVGVVALLLTVLAWPISALTRRHYAVPYRLTGQDAKSHRWVRIASTAVIVLCIAWATTVTAMMSNFKFLSSSYDWLLWLLQLLSLVAFPAAAVIGVLNAATVLRGQRKWYTKVWAIVLAIALIVLLWVAYAFHLIALDVNY
jgi:CubicO group peptidase (beta-lactamase class C family)